MQEPRRAKMKTLLENVSLSFEEMKAHCLGHEFARRVGTVRIRLM